MRKKSILTEQINKDLRNYNYLKFFAAFKQTLLTSCLFLLFLLFLLIIPNTNPPRNNPDGSLTYQIQQKFFPASTNKLVDMDFPARSGNPLEILRSPRNLNNYQLAQAVGYLHQDFIEKHQDQHLNESMQRLFMMLMQFESISRLRFNRGTGRLISQSDLEDLAGHILNSRWYRESLLRLFSNNAYGFSVDRMLRIFISIQAASHFFEVPYPALFCLFFQESKFDFLADSPTGAKGVGQLTSIGLREVQRLRIYSEMELTLQRTAEYLNQVYTDTQINIWLRKLGFKTIFPELTPIPKKIEFTRISSAFMRKVGKRLVEEGQSYGKKTSTLWYLSKRLRRGRILPKRYAHMHKVFSQMLEENYASSQASAYNIETNILLSTMLYNHYYKYRWRHSKHVYELPAQTRVILAAAAYNHGQTGIRRFLYNLKHEFPMLDFQNLSSQQLRILFTTRRLKHAIRRPFSKIREASRHVRKIMDCTEKRTSIL
ncbi:MAG: hypothetical protein MAG581_00013 [Deltaproteobacteria bacterium]|jgi:hypothetical protein|nr:hypothetical protein [Deltaproteobacteria bacterium]